MGEFPDDRGVLRPPPGTGGVTVRVKRAPAAAFVAAWTRISNTISDK
jgi:hypothetical protein